ncbi:transposase [uncultured Ferrimonas sp.]|uniref:REP-associated tyrosine transposase n=1 Tax=uncultured Ferrimonas sp. TaxID=432640 RepID=UPI002612FC93|nr:transposase [uncultured Ferrimonas sp.]
MQYRRAFQSGGCYFFTLVSHQRRTDLLLPQWPRLKEALLITQRQRPFTIDALCVMPDHLHLMLTLPQDDDDFPTRLRLFKTRFTKSLNMSERIWQRRYWEHLIRDPADYQAHFDYLHYNPVKHGLVTQVADWPYSTFHRYVADGVYPVDWGITELEIPSGQFDSHCRDGRRFD